MPQEQLHSPKVPFVFGSNCAQKQQAVEQLADLCDTGANLFRNWFDLVRHAYRAKDLAALATRAGLYGPSPVSHLQRCARGEMLTADTIQAVTARLKDPVPLRNLGMRTRVLAFAIDFIVAAHSGASPLDWSTAQATVRARILRLSQDLQLSFATGVRRETTSAEMTA